MGHCVFYISLFTCGFLFNRTALEGGRRLLGQGLKIQADRRLHGTSRHSEWALPQGALPLKGSQVRTEYLALIQVACLRKNCHLAGSPGPGRTFALMRKTVLCLPQLLSLRQPLTLQSHKEEIDPSKGASNLSLQLKDETLTCLCLELPNCNIASRLFIKSLG